MPYIQCNMMLLECFRMKMYIVVKADNRANATRRLLLRTACK